MLLRYGLGGGFFGGGFLTCGLLRGGFGFLLHVQSVGFGFLGFGASGLGLSSRFFGVGAALGFCFRIGAGFGFTGCGCGLGFVLCLLLDGHQAGFFGGFGGFLGGGLDGGLVLFLAIGFFGVHQLLAGFRNYGGSIFFGGGDVRDAHGVTRFEKFERSLRGDAEDGVLNMSVGGGVGA